MNAQLMVYYVIGIVITFGLSGISYWLSIKFKKDVSKKILYILIGLSSYLFIAQYLKFQSLHMYVDLSHWIQIVKSISTSRNKKLLFSTLHAIHIPFRNDLSCIPFS